MRNLLAEYPAWFEPDEVQILVAAFDKAWEMFCEYRPHSLRSGAAVGHFGAAAISLRVDHSTGLNGILLRPLSKVSVTTPDCAMVLCWL
jgi:hypothetical protein